MPIRVLPLDDLARKIRAELTPDLLKPDWRAANERDEAHYLTGHCYVASEAYYHLSGKKKGFSPKVLSKDGLTHWWLQDKEGKVIDLTAEQFKDGVEYTKGRGTGFLTKEPSKRAKELIKRVSPRSRTR